MFAKPKRKEKPKQNWNSQEALTDVLNFDDHDLKVNRSGRLTKKQKRRLVERATLFMLAIVLGYILGGSYIVLSFAAKGSDSSGLMIILILVGLALVLAVLSHTHRAANEGQVSSVHGTAFLQFVSGEEGGYYLSVQAADSDPVEFSIPRKVYDRIVEGTTYTVYYIPRTKEVVSAEWVPNEGRKRKRLSKQEIQESLTHALSFDSANLEANRNGRLSAAQKRPLMWRFFLGILLVGLVIGYAGLSSPQIMYQWE